MTVNHYPIGEVTDRPEWRAAKGKTPEETVGVATSTIRRATHNLTVALQQAAERFAYPQTIETEANR